jgi:transcriptional regulator with XRE-family HTH domain
VRFLSKVGLNIRKLREARGLTQEELASGAKLKQSHISKLESGVTEGSLSSLRRIADVLNVPVSELLGSCDEKREKEAI